MGFFEEPKVWKISHKWFKKTINCNIEVCGGGCCINPNFWPPKSGTINPGQCDFLTPTGCSLSFDDRPIDCNLYPLRLNKANTVVLHHRVQFKTKPCKENFGQGSMIIDSMRNCLVALFGVDQYVAMREAVMADRDFLVEVSDVLIARLQEEEELVEKNLPPIDRRKQVKSYRKRK